MPIKVKKLELSAESRFSLLSVIRGDENAESGEFHMHNVCAEMIKSFEMLSQS